EGLSQGVHIGPGSCQVAWQGWWSSPEAVQRFIGEAGRSTIFPPWFRISLPRPVRKESRRAIDRDDLKEKDTKMNGPARIMALAVALAGMVISMSGCDKLAARDQLNKGVDAYKGARYEEAIGHFQR